MVGKRINPFSPGAPVPSGIFSGRIRELKQIETSFYQTINDRPQHIMISGERAIGKTSIAVCSRLVAEGKQETFEKERLNLFAVNVNVNARQKLEDVLASAINTIQIKLGNGKSLSILKRIWDNVDEVKLGTASFKKAVKSKEISLSTDEFCFFIEGIWDKIKDEYQGILILIDEFDRLEDFNGVASFFKSLIERLGLDGYTRIMFLICGMPEMKQKLYEDHPSVLRNFEPVELKLMPEEEAREVINKALRETTVDIKEDALNFITNIAEGYPYFLQEIGYSAYEVNTDECIDMDDVRGGVLGTSLYSGSIQRLGSKYFDKMYEADIQSDTYREILSMIANEPEQFVSRQAILENFSKKKTSLDSYLQNLVKRGILVKEKSKLGLYAIPSKMFQIYIRMKTKLTYS